jgi:hypothetical protein
VGQNQIGNNKNVGFMVLIAVIMNNVIFLPITPCTMAEVDRRFGGTYCFHLQYRLSKRRTAYCILPVGFVLLLLFGLEDLRNVDELTLYYMVLQYIPEDSILRTKYVAVTQYARNFAIN